MYNPASSLIPANELGIPPNYDILGLVFKIWNGFEGRFLREALRGVSSPIYEDDPDQVACGVTSWQHGNESGEACPVGCGIFSTLFSVMRDYLPQHFFRPQFKFLCQCFLPDQEVGFL